MGPITQNRLLCWWAGCSATSETLVVNCAFLCTVKKLKQWQSWCHMCTNALCNQPMVFLPFLGSPPSRKIPVCVLFRHFAHVKWWIFAVLLKLSVWGNFTHKLFGGRLLRTQCKNAKRWREAKAFDVNTAIMWHWSSTFIWTHFIELIAS